MAHVILFNDNPPNNLGTDENPLLINYQTRAAGVYAIASKLRRSGYQVKVVDHASSLTLAGVKKIISDNSTDLLWVGIGTTFFSIMGVGLKDYRKAWANSTDLYFKNPASEFLEIKGHHYTLKTHIELIWGRVEINQIAKWCKEQYGVPILIGGSFVSSVPNGNLFNLEKNVYIIPGRSESYVTEATALLKNNPNAALPLFVNNDLFDNEEFKLHGYNYTDDDHVDFDEWLPIEVARGCSFNCAYCQYDRKSSFDTYKKPETLREEIIQNYEKFGVTKYLLVDDLYNDSKDKVRILYDKVWSRLPFKPEWASYMRLDMFWSDPESIDIVKLSGAKAGSFGIETLHQKAGSKVGKGLGRDRIIETLTNLKQSWKDDVIVAAYFIAGLPDEPEESILATQEWIRNTNLIDSVKWTPLYLSSPRSLEASLRPNQIALDNKKYGITWADDNTWINEQGITQKRANEIATLGNSGFPIGHFGHYVELRQIGWSHEKILKYIRAMTRGSNNSTAEFYIDYNNSKNVAIDNIERRVRKTLKI